MVTALLTSGERLRVDGSMVGMPHGLSYRSFTWMTIAGRVIISVNYVCEEEQGNPARGSVIESRYIKKIKSQKYCNLNGN
jgi:hypothetical protein